MSDEKPTAASDEAPSTRAPAEMNAPEPAPAPAAPSGDDAGESGHSVGAAVESDTQAANAVPLASETPVADTKTAETVESPKPTAAAASPVSGARQSETPSPPPRRSDWFARILVLLLWMALAGAAAAAWYFGRPLLAERDTRQDDLATRIEAIEAQLTSVGRDAEAQVSNAMTPLQARINAMSDQLAAEAAAQRSRVATAEQSLTDQMRRFDGRFQRIDERLARLTATDRRAWLVQESAFIVRLAGQRLAAARDVASAAALLQTADDLLAEAADPLLDAARRALAADLVGLRAVRLPDTVGLDARLDALISQTASLTLVPPEPELPPLNEGTLIERAEAGWAAAVASLSDYLVIRERSEEFSSLLTPDWEMLARQNLRMLLEQSQIALLSGNELLFQRALERARDFALLFEQADPALVAVFVAEIDALAAVEVAPELPTLLESRRALADATRQLVVESGD